VGLAGLVSVIALAAAKHVPTGLTMGALGLVIGFAFFGKNPANMLPIILGGFLYSKFAKVPAKDCILIPVLATSLAPAVTQLTHVGYFPFGVCVALGILVGLFIGFIMNPFAVSVRKVHEGYNLYNVGFASGILGLGLFALYRLIGINHPLSSVWSSGYNTELALFLAITSGYFILCGILSHGGRLSIKELIKPKEEGNDFYKVFAEKAYIGMGIMGLACLAVMFIVRGEYSGPVLGSILSVVGFGAFGKALASAAPIFGGAMLASAATMLITGAAFNSPGFLVAAFFSSCLSPFGRRFGVFWGFIAGFLHLSLATQIAIFHGGLNLYNNGFAGGLVAMILLPIVYFFRKETPA